MPELIEYVRTLADEIGPRPATTDAEHKAATYIEGIFASRGLETELQEFDSPRTYSWAYVLYHLLTIASAVIAGPIVLKGLLVWPAFALSAFVAFFLWMDLDTRFGLTRIMPKGPSQNVIARHVPRQRRGEKLRKIVVVAHYDSAKSSLAFSPNMVNGFGVTFGLLKAATFITPALILVMALPFKWLGVLDPWLWYVTLVVAGYLLVPTVINIHRELFMPFVDGANDNASGVAAMIGVMERLVAEPDANNLITGSFPAIKRSDEFREPGLDEAGVDAFAARATTTGSTGSLDLPDDFDWAESADELPRRSSFEDAEPPVPVSDSSARSTGGGFLEFDTIEFSVVPDESSRRRRSEPEPVIAEPERSARRERSFADAIDAREHAEERESLSAGPDVLPADIAGPAADDHDAPKREKKGLFSGFGKKRERRDEHAPTSDWLGVDDGFDARKAGADIGSWDNFGEETEDDDGIGWKGGWAGDDPIGDPEFARNEAARIRRRVTESFDRELLEKEVWFVATGAEEVGTLGMQAFLRDYGHEVRDALIINIDGCGSGNLFWASAEGMARRYRADHRLVSLARRVSRETETVIKPRVYKGLSTDATPALARGFKTISIMAFGANGLPRDWHWKSDTSDNVDPALIEKTAEFVTHMVREA